MSTTIGSTRTQERALSVEPELQTKTAATKTEATTTEASPQDAFARTSGNEGSRFVSARAVTADSSLEKNRQALEALAVELDLPAAAAATQLSPDAVTTIVAHAVERGTEALLDQPAFWQGLTIDLSRVPAEECSKGYDFESGALAKLVAASVNLAQTQLSPSDVPVQENHENVASQTTTKEEKRTAALGFETEAIGHDKQTFDKGRLHIKENVVTGRWADTLQGERANQNAGAGFHDEANLVGSSGAEVSSDPASGTSEPSAAALLWDGLFGWGNDDRARASGASLLELFMGGGRAKNDPIYGVPWPHRPGGHGSRGSERPDEDPIGEFVPVPIGQSPEPVKTGGLAGGAGDGRGELDPKDDNAGLLVDKAITTEITKAGGVIKERASGKISLEEALKPATWTDPVRS